MRIKPIFWVMVVCVGLILGSVMIWYPRVAPCANPGGCQTLPTLAINNNLIGKYDNQEVVPPQIDLAQDQSITKVLGEETGSGEKHIYVDLKNQTLKAYQGETLYMQTLVSTGKWNKTPPGDYTIWVKMRSTRMSGGEGNDAYDLPNVPYVMFFYNDKVPKIAGYSFHGAYWHDNFGHPMSHGCVNMRADDAEKLYDWATPNSMGAITYASTGDTGTKVTIY